MRLFLNKPIVFWHVFLHFVTQKDLQNRKQGTIEVFTYVSVRLLMADDSRSTTFPPAERQAVDLGCLFLKMESLRHVEVVQVFDSIFIDLEIV